MELEQACRLCNFMCSCVKLTIFVKSCIFQYFQPKQEGSPWGMQRERKSSKYEISLSSQLWYFIFLSMFQLGGNFHTKRNSLSSQLWYFIFLSMFWLGGNIHTKRNSLSSQLCDDMKGWPIDTHTHTHYQLAVEGICRFLNVKHAW